MSTWQEIEKMQAKQCARPLATGGQKLANTSTNGRFGSLKFTDSLGSCLLSASSFLFFIFSAEGCEIQFIEPNRFSPPACENAFVQKFSLSNL
jgi:hypothetical protein